MAGYDWDALFDCIEQGMTTGEDADAVRDLLEKATDLETALSKLNDEDLFGDDEEQ